MGNWRDGSSTGRTAAELEAFLAPAEGLVPDPYQAALGQLGENFNLTAAANTSALSNGVEYYMAIRLVKNVQVTKLIVMSTVIGTAPTLLKMGIRDKTFNRVAVSGDQKATDNAVGKRAFSMLSAITPTATDLYYATILWTGGAGFSINRGLSHAIDTRNPGATSAPFALATGRADIDAGIVTPPFTGTAQLPLWVAWA